MIKTATISICIFFCVQIGNAQKARYTANHDALNALKDQFIEEGKQKEKRIAKYLRKNKQKQRSFFLEGNELSIIDIRNGMPVYYTTYNDGSVRSLGVDELRAGGRFGIDVAGENINLGVWDRGLPLAEHNEFQGRLMNSDAASEFSFHSTHVTGTIIAGGVNPSAKGFCYRADIRAFDWFQDTEEMVDEVLNQDLMVSNHSYGVPGGWNGANWLGDLGISDVEDYRFGYYDAEARNFDNIAYNAPYYSIVVAAGNERGDSGDGSIPPDGPYDCITGFSNSKNVFTVGAVRKLQGEYTGPEDIVMSSFSSWGPVDDGRIKPDFCAPGVDLLSASNEGNNAYGVSSGTSMASPSVAGVVALVNEAYLLFNNSLLKSATIKALLIHSAFEAGDTPGPDYEFGWGMVNAEKAVEFIQEVDGVNRQLIEGRLEEGEIYEIELNPQSGQKITATLVWTDPAGDVPPRILDPEDLTLVNDLDMSINDTSGAAAWPWILDPSMPMNAATTGDNFRDNVEKIEFNNPDSRPYTLRISHKGTLVNGAQDFSLILEYTSESSGITNLYWIDDNGNWNDGTHWSLSSGGGGSNSIPDANTRVVIDDNSIQGNSGSIVLEADAEIASLVAFTDKSLLLDLGGHTLTVGGTLSFSSDNFTIRNGKIVFTNSDELFNAQIDLHLSELEDINLHIGEQNQATWLMQDSDLIVDKFSALSGTVDFDNISIVSDSIELKSNIRSSAGVYMPTSYFVLGSDISFESNGTNSLIANNKTNLEIDLANVNTNFDLNVSGSDCTVSCTGTINDMLVDNSIVAWRQTNQSLSELAISNGSSIVLENNVVLRCVALSIQSEASDPVSLTANDAVEKGALEILERAKYCFENLMLENLDLLGSSSVGVGTNSTLINSDNWFVGACQNLLFADFTSEYLCEGGLANFQDISDGNVSAWSWSVNGEQQSIDSDFEFYFESEGIYDVGLTVFDDLGNSNSWTSPITIEESQIAENGIFQNETQLISLNLADRYQWYNYGQAVPGETDRIYIYNGEVGVYWVLTYEGSCNRRSEILDLDTDVVDLDADKNDIFNLRSANPVNDIIHIEWLTEMGGSILSLFDINGRKLLEKRIEPGERLSEFRINEAPSGSLLMFIQKEDSNYVKRLIKAE